MARNLDAKWKGNARAVGNFHRKHGRWPSKTASGSRERYLGNWLHLQRRAAREEPEWFEEQGRRAYLDEVAPWWQGLNKETRWLLNAYEVKRIFQQEGEWPTTTDPDPRRRQIGEWLVKRRSEARKGRLSKERLELLNRVVPGWRAARTGVRLAWREAAWDGKLASAVAYADAHGGKTPPQKYVDPQGRRIGLWLTRQRQTVKKGKLSAQRQAKLDRALPNWRGGRR